MECGIDLAVINIVNYINNGSNINNINGGRMNTIQEERVKGYFIAAAKDLIRGEGLEVVSTRNVAQRAGYSYATLYNYFKDVRDLIFSCIEDFLQECREFVEKGVAGMSPGKDRFIAVTENYARFFIQYPGTFDLLFQQRVSSIATTNSDVGRIYTFFDSLTDQDWETICGVSPDTVESKKVIREYHKLAIHGLLMLYLSRRKEGSYQEFMEQVKELSSLLLNS